MSYKDLTPKQVAEIVQAHAKHVRAQADANEAKEAWQKISKRHEGLFPVGVLVDVHGAAIKLTQTRTGEQLALSKVREAGYKIPRHIARFITPSRPYKTWSVGVSAEASS